MGVPNRWVTVKHGRYDRGLGILLVIADGGQLTMEKGTVTAAQHERVRSG